jgi:hypothetical protein
MLGLWLLAGCGPTTTNEEGFVPSKDAAPSDGPKFSSYSEYMAHQREEALKKDAEAKPAKKSPGRR